MSKLIVTVVNAFCVSNSATEHPVIRVVTIGVRLSVSNDSVVSVRVNHGLIVVVI